MDILRLNAHLKYTEFLLGSFDTEPGCKTIGELRNDFEEKFLNLDRLLNQYFGICRLLPLILIKEEYKNSNKELKGDIEKIKIIRDAVVHNRFEINEGGYTFTNDRHSLKIKFPEFVEFLHSNENKFYSEEMQKPNN